MIRMVFMSQKYFTDLLLNKALRLDVSSSVTRLGDFLHFGKLIKAGGNNYFTQIAHILRQFS